MSCHVDGLNQILFAKKLSLPATEALHEQLTIAKRGKLTSNEGNNGLYVTESHSFLSSSFIFNYRDCIDSEFQEESLPFPVVDFNSSIASHDEEHAVFSETLAGETMLDEMSETKHVCSTARIGRPSCHGMVRSQTILSSICLLDLAQ